MNSTGVTTAAAAICVFVCLTGSSAAEDADGKRPPNVVLLFADDLGFGDLGCYGHPYARTPAIDRLAEEGTRFTQFYVTGVTCNPSRTGLMTGVFPARLPKYPADFGFGDRVTITELLQERGYRTGHFGKWHIGSNDADGTYGIDTVRTIGSSRDRSAGRDDDLYSAAIAFIRQHRDEPFYVNVWGHATHFPVNTPAALAAEFDDVTVDPADFPDTMQHKFAECRRIGGDLDECMRQYLGDVLQIDRNVGRVTAVLDELGLREKTIVVFSSDHGPAPLVPGNRGVREYSQNMLGSAGPFRGGKHEQYEGGTRVPFIIRWPGQVPAGRVDSRNVCSFIDWLPTLCAITGVEDLPPRLDGEDVSDIWRGADRRRSKPLFWKTSAVRSPPVIRDGRWKLHLNLRGTEDVELYDLAADPAEATNVAAEHPEVVVRLEEQLRAWVAELPTDYEKSGKTRRKDRD